MSTFNPSITTALGLLDREALERGREAVVTRNLDFFGRDAPRANLAATRLTWKE